MSLNGYDDRALADVLGGMDGGWYFWLAFLAMIEDAIALSRERMGSFTSYPRGELGRMLRDVEDAFGLASTAVAVQQLVNEEELDLPEATIADVLARRVAEVKRLREEVRP